MTRQPTRAAVEAWLRGAAFRPRDNGSGHRVYTHEPSGRIVAVPIHGPAELTPRIFSRILRSIAAAGFDRRAVREAL